MKPVASLAATSHGGDSPDSLRLLSSAVPSFYAPCSKDMEHLRMSQHKCLAPDVAMTSSTYKLVWYVPAIAKKGGEWDIVYKYVPECDDTYNFFRDRYLYFSPGPVPVLFFWDQFFPVPVPVPSKKEQSSRDREFPGPGCHTLLGTFHY